MDRKGNHLETVTKPGSVQTFAMSPDARGVIINPQDKEQSDLWLQDLARGTLSRFTFGLGSVTDAIWSPDSSRTIFGAGLATSFSYDMFQKPTSGAGKEKLIGHAGVNAFPSDWAPDGKSIVYSALDAKTNYDLWLLPVAGGGSASGELAKPVVYLQTPFNERAARFSPDGHWMAYSSDESGQYEVYVQTIPTSGAKWQVSTGGGVLPMWRKDGKELYYVADQKLMAVAVRNTPAGFEAGQPEPLFDGVRTTDFTTAYQPAPDGQRFLVNLPAVGEAAAAPPVTVFLNWQMGLKK